MPAVARYDGLADWYEAIRGDLSMLEVDVLDRLLGRGDGRCLDVGCGSGVASAALMALGWTVVGVDASADLVERARARGVDVVHAEAGSLPFEDASFDAAISLWTHTDIDDFAGAVRELARVVRPDARFVYVGSHPCFVGPHSQFVRAVGVPRLHPGYRAIGRYEDAPGISPEGIRARVGATHLTLAALLSAFLDAGFALEQLEEPCDDDREYPYMLALGWRRLRGSRSTID